MKPTDFQRNINAKMQESLDLATDPWGIKVTRVELRTSIPRAIGGHGEADEGRT